MSARKVTEIYKLNFFKRYLNMKIPQLIYSAIFAAMTLSCSSSEVLDFVVTDNVVNPSYIGNGVEWDPYDEADSWGAPVSDDDWAKLFSRLDYMRPQYVRCMINSPFRYYDTTTGKYDKKANTESLCKLLQYCTDNDITVIYGEYNPPVWDMKNDPKWVDMAVDYLNMLVVEKGFSCIKYFVIFNEPDGDWASTNGDFELWCSMAKKFHTKMEQYPGLIEKVKLAGPDVVADYHNKNSELNTAGWLVETVKNVDSIIGLYDIHAYPGQAEVLSGNYSGLLSEYKSLIPEGKQIVLGEAGYKYWREADSLLMKEYNRRVEGHPFTKGSDCNMLVYDYFYGIDMAILATEVMNCGFSGVAAWMLDDAMHSQGDSGKPEDIKLWGMWNILGEEVFNDPSQEDIRPWFYSWSLMCRYFPRGCDIVKIDYKEDPDIFACAANYDGKYSIAIINKGDKDKDISVRFPQQNESLTVFRYEEDNLQLDDNGFLAPEEQGIVGDRFSTGLSPLSMILVTQIK